MLPGISLRPTSTLLASGGGMGECSPFPPGASPPLDAAAPPGVTPRLGLRGCCTGGPVGTGALGTRPCGAAGGHDGAAGCDGLRGGHVIGGGYLGCSGPWEGAVDGPREPPPNEEPPPSDDGRPGGDAFLADGCSSIATDDARDWSLFIADPPSPAVSMTGFSFLRTGWRSVNEGYVPAAVTVQPLS